MKSPRINTSTIGYILTLCLIHEVVHCDQNVVLWTQRSAIWSHIRGVSGDIRGWLGLANSVGYNYVRGESQKHTNLIGISYDHVTKTVCWSEAVRHGLYCQPLNSTASRSLNDIKTILEHDVLDIKDISIDWQTGNIYFAAGRFIAVAPSWQNSNGVYKHLLSSGFVDVSGIVVDPTNNYLFWSDKATSSISRSTLAGKDRQLLRQSDRGQPLGVTVNPAQRRVYWVDNLYGNIESTDYDGREFKRHAKDQHDSDFTGLALHAGYAFVTGTHALKLYVYDATRPDFTYVSEQELDATPHYITAMEDFPAKPPHACDTLGCEHICLNLGQSRGVCTCKTGYFLNLDGLTCTERRPRYVYSTGREVLLASASVDYSDVGRVILDEAPLVRDQQAARALAYHYGRNKLFFSDVITDVIYRCSPDGDDKGCEEHTVNTRNVEGLTIDWLTSNVYWADREIGHVMVSWLDGRYHRILVPHAGQPTGIAVDAKRRRMFWNDVTEGRESIITSRLDGLQQVRIVDYSTGIMHPQGIFVDPHNERLYWVDKDLGEIECADYLGRHRRKIVTSIPTTVSLYDVTLYQELTAYSNVKGGLRFRNNLVDEDLALGGDSSQRIYTQTYDVIAFDSYMQPQGENPCGRNNGGCAQLCFGTPDGQTSCECAIGFSLNDDKTSCDTLVLEEYFVIFTDPYHKQVYQSNLSIEYPQAHGLHLPSMDHPVSVDYDTGKGRVFWIDLAQRAIKRAKLDGSEERVLMAIPQGSSPTRLCVDPVQGFLYYTDSARGTLSRMTLSGDDHTEIFTGLTTPTGVAVDYHLQIIAWTSGDKVEVADVTGENRRVVVDSLLQPAGVSFLTGENMLYFSDNQTGMIFAHNITSNIRSMLYEYAGFNIQSLAVSPDHVYFTTYNEKAVFRLDRLTGDRLSTVGQPVFARIMDIKVVQGSVVPAYQEDGFSWVILGGALAGLLLLLLVLLTALLGVRRRKRKQAAAASADSEGGGGHNDVDREYTYLNQAKIFDIRGSHDALMNGNGKAKSNGSLNGTINGNGAVVDGDVPSATGFDDITSVTTENMYTETPNGHVESTDTSKHNGTNGLNGTNGVPTGGVAVIGASTEDVGPAVLIAASKKPKYKQNKKTQGRHKKKTLPKDQEFEITQDNKVATRIQRLANRLRNRLSSVRWSSGEKDDDPAPNPEPAPTHQVIGPPKTGPAPNGRKVDIPPKLHEMPRGFAPASHCRPVNVRKSINAQKAKNMLERTDSATSATSVVSQ